MSSTSDQYEVGAGTLREALLLLVTDALVVEPGATWIPCRPISLADFEDITRTRVLLETEPFASRSRGDDAWEADLVASFHRLSRAEQKLAEPTRHHRRVGNAQSRLPRRP